MSKISEVDQITSAIIEHYKNDVNIKMIYLFGSITDKSKFSPKSDVDIAIYLKNFDSKNFDRIDFISKLQENIMRDVDLIVLNQADIIITMQVLQNGQLIYSDDNGFFAMDYKSKKMSEYIDFKKARQAIEKAILDR